MILTKIIPDSLSFDLPPASKKDINQIVKSLNSNKATRPNGTPLKLSTKIADKYLTSIINHDISRSHFSGGAKNALVRRIYKKKDKQNKENYRPVSILNGFPKVYETFIDYTTLPITQSFLSNFVSAYRKDYSANHVLIRLIENWKKNFHNNKIVGAVFMDLPNAFDCIPHDLLIAKMETYGFSVFILEALKTIRKY